MFGNLFNSILGTKRDRTPSPQGSDEDDSDSESSEFASVDSATAVEDDNGSIGGAGAMKEDAAAAIEAQQEEFVKEEEEEAEYEDFEGESNWVTLAQKLTQIVPDADIRCPNVILVGSQTAGKTKMIISLVFFHLIDNKYFTDAMGEALLKLFQTGSRMVTMRPTTVVFNKTDLEECDITIALGSETVKFGDDARFDEILDMVIAQSVDQGSEAFEQELAIYISAPGLPNIEFTDLPGLITKDKTLADNENLSMTKLIVNYMTRPNTTVVVVEPAAIEDLDTSHVSPLMKEIQQQARPDIFNNSILVLSKCDKIRQGLEPRVMDMINLNAEALVEYPYKYVVGVVNKIEGSEDHGDAIKFSSPAGAVAAGAAAALAGAGISPSPSKGGTPLRQSSSISSSSSTAYKAFKKRFRNTRAHEKEVFSHFINADGSTCKEDSQCSTAAVFQKMEHISFDIVYTSIKDGIAFLSTRINESHQRIRSTLAPPFAFYNRHQQSSSSSGEVKVYTPMKVLGPELKRVLKQSIVRKLEKITYLPKGCWDHEKYGCESEFMVDNVLGGWFDFRHCSFEVYSRQKRTFQQLERMIHEYIEEKIPHAIIGIMKAGDRGCFSKKFSPFHRLDRFPVLVEEITGRVHEALDERCVEPVKKMASEYLWNYWKYEHPKGIAKRAIIQLLDQLRHLSLVETANALFTLIDNPLLFEDVLKDESNFEESEEFKSQRASLEQHVCNWERQRNILSSCLHVRSNEALRAVLERADQHIISPDTDPAFWVEFWTRPAPPVLPSASPSSKEKEKNSSSTSKVSKDRDSIGSGAMNKEVEEHKESSSSSSSSSQHENKRSRETVSSKDVAQPEQGVATVLPPSQAQLVFPSCSSGSGSSGATTIAAPPSGLPVPVSVPTAARRSSSTSSSSGATSASFSAAAAYASTASPSAKLGLSEKAINWLNQFEGVSSSATSKIKEHLGSAFGAGSNNTNSGGNSSSSSARYSLRPAGDASNAAAMASVKEESTSNLFGAASVGHVAAARQVSADPVDLTMIDDEQDQQ